jgi:hypothetical protein
MQKDDEPTGSLDQGQLDELVQHLEATEEASRASALESVESLHLWLTNHPALRQMAIVDSIAQIGPAILRFLRAMLGLDRRAGDPPDVSKTDRGD